MLHSLICLKPMSCIFFLFSLTTFLQHNQFLNSTKRNLGFSTTKIIQKLNKASVCLLGYIWTTCFTL